MNILFFFIMYFFVYQTIIFNDVQPNSLIFKFLSSLCFFLCALFSFKKSPTTKKYSLIIISALFFDLIGDVFLSSSINNSFILGASAFIIGHILFIIAFSLISKIHIKDFIIAILISLAAIFFIKNNPNFNLGDKLPIVYIYPFTISLMLVKAFTLFKLRNKNTFFIYFTILGALLFIISDCILVFEIFLIHAPEYLTALNLITYYTGEGLIALSLSDTVLTSSKNCNNT